MQPGYDVHGADRVEMKARLEAILTAANGDYATLLTLYTDRVKRCLRSTTADLADLLTAIAHINYFLSKYRVAADSRVDDAMRSRALQWYRDVCEPLMRDRRLVAHTVVVLSYFSELAPVIGTERCATLLDEMMARLEEEEAEHPPNLDAAAMEILLANTRGRHIATFRRLMSVVESETKSSASSLDLLSVVFGHANRSDELQSRQIEELCGGTLPTGVTLRVFVGLAEHLFPEVETAASLTFASYDKFWRRYVLASLADSRADRSQRKRALYLLKRAVETYGQQGGGSLFGREVTDDWVKIVKMFECVEASQVSVGSVSGSSSSVSCSGSESNKLLNINFNTIVSFNISINSINNSIDYVY